MKCLFCKKEIADGSLFCNYCGRKQERSNRKSRNGSGYVFKRGQTYTARARVYVNGSEYNLTKGGFKTKRDAYASIPDLLAQLTLGKTERISFCDLWTLVQNTERFRSLSDEKKKAWRYAYDKCSSLYVVKDFRDIRYEHLAKVVKGLTYYPARDVKVLLNAMYQEAFKRDLCDKNYAESIELPKLEKKREKEVFTAEEVQKLWECLDPFRDYILIMCFTGLRPIEMRKLRKDDLHLDEGYMMGGQKTEHSKVSPIAIPGIIVPLLERFKPITYGKSQFERKFADTLMRAGIDRDLTPGCCRHTFITNMTKTVDSAAIIQKAARHTKYQTTLNYTHLKIDDVQDAVNLMADNIAT